jgi:oligoribonuclease NrnB/cAMP/cGMP phosphodiesterase (DHH superfamily)
VKKIFVLYHFNCPDGFGAAWAAWKKFGKKADYIGIRPSQTADQLKGLNLKDKEEIYFLDVSASAQKLKELVKNNESVTVIDHHVSNREIIRNASQWVFDNRHSGAVLTWQFFFPKKPVPWLLRYLEEMDLWKFRLPHTKEIIAWLEFFPMEFRIWDKLARNLERATFRKSAINEGKMFLKYENRLIEGILKYAFSVKFKGYRARVVNSPKFQSQLGHRLLDKRHPVAIVWNEAADGLKFSLRSDGRVDVSKLAKSFLGGGGHKAAAGFSLPFGKKLPWKRIKK